MAHIRTLTGLLPQSTRFSLRKVLYHGAQETCPFCLSHIRGYGPHGGGGEILEQRQVVGGMRREHDSCPVCHGRDRTRLMMRYLETRTAVRDEPVSILHVAPDYGLYLWLMRQPEVSYVGTDLDASRYRHIKNMQSADLTQLPFDDESFDIVICSHVLEHVPDDDAALRAMHRVLKPGGHALLLVPLAIDGLDTDEDLAVTDPVERDRRFGQWDHVRLYGRDDFLRRMQQAGFSVSVFDPCAEDPSLEQSCQLNPLEVLPIGRKA